MNEKAVLASKPSIGNDAQLTLWQEYITEDLPSSYDENRLVALIRDPYTIYIYWDVAEDTCAIVREFLGGNSMDVSFFARVYEFTAGNMDFNQGYCRQTIQLAPMANNWYVQDLSPNCSYLVDIGIMVQGNFITILRSNLVSTPPDTEGPGRELWPLDHLKQVKLESWSSKTEGFSANSSISFYR